MRSPAWKTVSGATSTSSLPIRLRTVIFRPSAGPLAGAGALSGPPSCARIMGLPSGAVALADCTGGVVLVLGGLPVESDGVASLLPLLATGLLTGFLVTAGGVCAGFAAGLAAVGLALDSSPAE